MASRSCTADLTSFLSPDSIMTMKGANKRMGYFMQQCIANMIFFGIAHIMPRKRDDFIRVITLARTPACMVEAQTPS
jgi:hypothetical protein